VSAETGYVWRASIVLSCVLCATAVARAQTVSFAVADGAGFTARTSVRLASTRTTTTTTGTVDALQAAGVPADELRTIEVRARGRSSSAPTAACACCERALRS